MQGESQAQDLDMRVLQMMSQSRHVFLANTVTPVGDVSASRRFYFDALLNQMVTDLRGAKVFSYRHLKTTTSGCMIDGRIDGEQLEELRHWVAARQEAGVLRNVEWQA